MDESTDIALQHDADVAAALKLKHLYIAWVRFQRRPLSMQSYIGYDLVHLPPPYTRRLAKPFGYLRQMMQTARVIRRYAPDVVWFQSPPTFIAHILSVIRAVSRKKFKIVADCHNGALDPSLHGGIWAAMPGNVALMNRFDVVLAHNAEIREIALRRGFRSDKLLTVETRPAPIPIRETPARPSRPTVLVPCSFQNDEPIAMLLDAAALTPTLTFILTGNAARATPKAILENAPDNVQLTGFLSANDYTKLLTSADIVLGLTTVEGIQLSAANEAIGAGRPLVLSDTQILKGLFGEAALFAANESAQLAATLVQALDRLPQMAAASRKLKDQREARWQGQINACLARLV